MDENTVTVAGSPDAAASARCAFSVVSPHWISGEPESGRVQLKLRHGPKIIDANIRPLEPAADGSARLAVTMDEPDRGLAPGQFSVFYDGDVCLGGAMIE
jgi:tRNA-specific 2-thiouridylase